MSTHATERFLVPRMDAVEKSTGAATYTEDLPLPYGTLYASILHSPYAHARLVSINVERAESLPGVHAVLTRDNLQLSLIHI